MFFRLLELQIKPITPVFYCVIGLLFLDYSVTPLLKIAISR